MLLNLDVWNEIVNCLEYPEDIDVLSSLVVTSRRLSDLALNVVWRNGENISDIVPIINSFAPSPNEPFLLYLAGDYDDEGEDSDSDSEGSFSSYEDLIGSWVLNGPLPPAACRRALGYLARIKSLRVDQRRTLSGEESLWPILACLCSHGPILPNLQRLEVTFFIYDRSEYLIPLLSPSIKTLLIECVCPPKRNAVSTFLNFAKVRGCDLEGFSYLGCPTHKVFEAITIFKTLQNVCFPFDEIPQLKAPFTLVQFLTSLPSLRSLTCHIGVFTPLAMGGDRFCHTSLQKIKIKSSQETLRDLFRMCLFPSVTKVKIVFDEVLSMEGIESSCPNTRKLGLSGEASAPRTNPPLEFKHVAPLLSLPIHSFSLCVRKHTLTPSDLRSFAESWSNIRSLKIISNTKFDPLSSLAVFVNHQHLDCLDLCLPLQGLFDVIPKMRNLIETNSVAKASRSALRSLSLHCRVKGVKETPVSEEGKRVLVEYLLRLFPSLKDLKFKGIFSSSNQHSRAPGDLGENGGEVGGSREFSLITQLADFFAL